MFSLFLHCTLSCHKFGPILRPSKYELNGNIQQCNVATSVYVTEQARGYLSSVKKTVQMHNINRNISTDKEESICCILNDDFGWDSDLGHTQEIKIFQHVDIQMKWCIY